MHKCTTHLCAMHTFSMCCIPSSCSPMRLIWPQIVNCKKLVTLCKYNTECVRNEGNLNENCSLQKHCCMQIDVALVDFPSTFFNFVVYGRDVSKLSLMPFSLRFRLGDAVKTCAPYGQPCDFVLG